MAMEAVSRLMPPFVAALLLTTVIVIFRPIPPLRTPTPRQVSQRLEHTRRHHRRLSGVDATGLHHAVENPTGRWLRMHLARRPTEAATSTATLPLSASIQPGE